uniref:ATPase inhibitor, mitochondrial n=1 Tax=Anas zonorhyncha TaxID=75864 RepID=A0A8B9V157_9AVES
GALVAQQQRAWSSGSGADQVGAAGRGGGGRAAAVPSPLSFLAREQLTALRKHHEEEIDHHKKEIERLQKEIERHKYKIKKLKDDD